MEFSVNREVIFPVLNKTNSLVKHRQTLPVLGNLLVVAREGRVTITGTDLEAEIKTSFEAEIKQEGEVTIPARKLLDICRNLSDGVAIRFKVKDERCTVTAGRGRFALGLLPAADFPTMDLEEGGFDFQIQEGQLKQLLEKIAFAMAQQDVRYYLNGALFELDPAAGLVSVATDGHRLAKFVTPLDALVSEKRQAIIPHKAVIELKRLLGTSDDLVAIRLGERSLRVAVGTMTLTSKLIDGRYPEYERVIPAYNGSAVLATVETNELKRALSQTAILSKGEKYPGVRLDFAPGVLKLMTRTSEQEEAENEIDIEYTGDAVSIGFSIAYLIEALGAIEESRAEIRFQDGNGSAVLRGLGAERETFVVMPMRL
ncbi:DNA polymerase III subunit beta [Allochromatium humboldtianum]|uniref:Beta sliding clamp n=1 Tax=Allochromatium humboldtianum TaxID=504901 RepID=A0A850RE37_9GAMM|nr:DNA polymerase III subunit beta [Allochromatium humboldtianum]NVZ11215.1 DNA polymerase III subunit beta [Allochromatium humboldtianum]